MALTLQELSCPGTISVRGTALQRFSGRWTISKS